MRHAQLLSYPAYPHAAIPEPLDLIVPLLRSVAVAVCPFPLASVFAVYAQRDD